MQSTSIFLCRSLGKRFTLHMQTYMIYQFKKCFQVAAYLMMRKGMSSAEALETIRQSRPIRPNPGFLQQLADHENLLSKKLVWS